MALSFPLWFLGRSLRGESVLAHDLIDQHTRQARAWLGHRIDLPRPPEDLLEIAHYKGRAYDSFPPTPSIFEVPLVLIFGTRKTPSGMVVYGFLYAALAAQFAALRRRGFSMASAMLTPLAFLFGTNVFASCTLATVWGYGQGLGYALAALGICLVMYNGRRLVGPGLGYACLSLAVGCRPLLLFQLPVQMAVDWRTNDVDFGRVVRRAIAWMAPFCLALAVYNWVRFDNPLEFGHRYLPWAHTLAHGIFSIHYMSWNAYHAFLRLPEWRGHPAFLWFDTLGTAFWLNNGVLVLAFCALVSGEYLDPWVRWAGVASCLVISAGILAYESSGNVQFGARYFIDLLPSGFAIFALAYRRFGRWAVVLSLVALGLNLYGLAAWQALVTLNGG